MARGTRWPLWLSSYISWYCLTQQIHLQRNAMLLIVILTSVPTTFAQNVKEHTIRLVMEAAINAFLIAVIVVVLYVTDVYTIVVMLVLVTAHVRQITSPALTVQMVTTCRVAIATNAIILIANVPVYTGAQAVFLVNSALATIARIVVPVIALHAKTQTTVTNASLVSTARHVS